MKPWVAHYDAGVPASLVPYPEKTLLDYLTAWARERGSEAAVLFKGTTLSYGQLETASDACAAALWSAGVRKGDRVALVLPNCPQFLIAQYGSWKIGAVVVGINPTYTDRELEHMLVATTVETVITLTPFYDRVKRVQGRTSVTRVIATSIKEYLPPLLRMLFTLFKERKDGHRIQIAAGDVWLRDLLKKHRGTPRPSVTVGPDDQAVILPSGGTTGTPKGVIGVHRNYVAAGLQLHAWTASLNQPTVDVIMLPLPLFHVYANVGVQSMALVGRNPLSLVPNPRDLNDLLASIQAVKPAFFSGVPTLYTAILNHPDVRARKVDLSSIKVCFSGSAALMAETKRAFEAQTGARILEGYALTESMMACCINPVMGPGKVGSIGMPLPDVNVRIVDADTGATSMPVGEVGELVLHAPQCMSGYWNNPTETKEVLRTDAEGRQWLHTGDLAYMDEDGYFFLVDRKKDMLKTSGYQVWPREIEEVIASHPSVLEVGVAGVPDVVKGEVAKAWVVLKHGATANEDDIRSYCRERLAPYKVPAAVAFRDELPKTMVGKVLRRVLAAEGAQPTVGPEAH